jgi:stage V sporulation protein D (sporulation-specific penicillin-binding protein)
MNHKSDLLSILQSKRKSKVRETDTYTGRFLVLILIIIAICIAIIVQLFRLQVISAKKYNTKAMTQYVDTNSSTFERGTIYFTEKDGTLISAATVTTGYKVAINPSILKDGEIVYPLIKNNTKLSYEEFIEKTKKKSDTYEEVANKLTEAQYKKIKEMKIQGVSLFRESWRNYPGKNLASQVLGFVGFNKDVSQGQYGLERQYDDILSPNKNKSFVNFFAEVFSNIDTGEKNDTARMGSIVTTIEPTVQAFLQDELVQLRARYGSESVGGIIMDPKTGEIIAMANMPDFDPNNFNTEKDPHVYQNPIVEGVFEIGSVVKILTMAAGLDAGVVNPDTVYVDTGVVELDTESLYNAGRIKYGAMSMQQVLDKSLNTGAVFVMQKLGKEKFKKYFYDFGLKEKTGIDLPNEVNNKVSGLESPRTVEYATAAFGQGIALTPISAIRAFAVVANGGYSVTPHIVKKIVYEDGTEKVLEYKKGKQVLDPTSSVTLSGMLRKVVDTALLGGKVKLANHTGAAKTGTAQIAKPTGGYLENAYLHTMVSYFPAFDTRYIIFLYNMKPQADDFAAQTMAPTSFEIGQFLMTYYNVPGDRVSDKK